MRDDILYKVLAGNVTCPTVIEQMAVSRFPVAVSLQTPQEYRREALLLNADSI
jgi:hypothetical protein